MKTSVLRARRTILQILLGALLLGVFVVVSVLFTHKAHAVAGINQQFNFQGRLLNSQGAAVADGNYNIQFKIYQDGAGTAAGNPGGTLKWTESWLNVAGKGVQVKNGYMSVNLGSVTAFGNNVDWNQDTLFLSINVGNTNATCTPFTSCAGDGEMLPMKRLSATPYALNAGMIEGKHASDFLQIAQGVQTDVSTNTPSIFINKTSTGNFLQYQTAGTDAYAVTNSGDVQFGANANHTISVASSPAGVAGKNLTISAGSASAGGAASAGGTLALQGGNAAGTGNNNGGSITLAGGTGVGTGYNGVVNISATAFSAGTNTTCAADCTISQSIIDANGTAIVSASTIGINITLPAPRNAPAGRIIYITTTSGSTDFNLTANSGTDQLNVTMRQNTTATMVWNGTAWTPGGASNAITLQATYNNGSNPAAVPEIKLDSNHGTIDIQDADTSIGTDILNVRGSNAGGLGTVLFGVSDTGRVTIQGTTDQSSAFRVLNSSNDYQLNVNSANGYVINNSTTSVDNDIANPGFEAGGTITGGEEGWSGSTQATFPNDAANARTGNYSMKVLPNSTSMDFYAGSYREVRAGDSYYLGGYVKKSGANGSAGVQITWYGKDKNVLSYSTNYNSSVTTSYTLYSISATAPANSVYAKVSGTVRNDANAGSYYFDDFNFIRNMKSAPYTFRNTADSTTAFRIQSAGSAQTLFTANTTDNILKVGDSTGSDTATTLLVLDSATTDPTTLANKDGGLFYNSSTGSFKAVIGGSVVDICTTAVTCSGYSASAGSVIQLQASSPGSQQAGNFNISGTGILTALKTQDSASGSTSALTIKTGNAAGAGTAGNLILDVGTGGTGVGSISIGHAGVGTTMAGTLAIQGNNSLTLGSTSSTTGSVSFNNAIGPNKVTLKGPNANPLSSPSNGGTASDYSLILPTQMGDAGTCIKTNATGELYFQNCGVGANVNLQDVYNNSGSPAAITTTDAKNLTFIASDTASDPNVLIDLQCATSCGTNGRFAVQNSGTDVLSVSPNGKVQVGSATTNSTLNLFQLDSYDGDSAAELSTAGCSTTINQGALYYNTSMGSLRGCMGASGWVDVSNPDTLGLLTFGVIPSSGGPTNSYDLPSLANPGISGPCRVSWASTTTVNIQGCTAYSGGRRVTVQPVSGMSVSSLTNANNWGHICLTGANSAPTLSAGSSSETANLPTWNIANPVLCLADIRMTTSGGTSIAAIYDTRTFSSTQKEPVNTSQAVSLGMLADAGGTAGAMKPSASGSQKLYGAVIVADSTTPSSSTSPNAIVTTIGAAWVKANGGTAGGFVISSTTGGYATTTGAIPNNSFYYSAGNTRTSYTVGATNTACSSAAACSGSLYVNFVVR
jgi:hypothetical protein